MSAELVRAQEIRTLIANWQTREMDYSPAQVICRYVGELASIDPKVGVMIVEGIVDPSIRIRALVQASESTDDIAPIIDAVEITQSESIPEPDRGRKLELIAKHALQGGNPILAVDIARDIEGVAPRARVLLAVAIREKDPALLQEVDQLSADHKLGRSIDRSLMWEGKKTVQYRVGVNAAKREHARLARSEIEDTSEEAQYKTVKYVVDCLVDALNRGDTRTLNPIADDIAVATELHKQHIDGKQTYRLSYAFSASDVDRLALGFSNAAPEASKALYKVVKKIADNNIKRITKRQANRRAAANKPAAAIVDQGIGLLNSDEIAAELGLLDDALGKLDDPFEL